MLTLCALSVAPDISVKLAVVVGRHPDCDTQINSHRVSRWHCVLTRDGDDVVVRDLGSRNGTWINGKRVASGRLRPGDEMAIGNVFYRLCGSPTYDRTLAELPPEPDTDGAFLLYSPSYSGLSSEDFDHSKF
jgi:hypothetical protein